VWIYKGRESADYNQNALGVVTSTAGAADTAVDDITAAFIQKRTRLVDRQNAALIQAEQKYQTGGNVTEQDMLSIGQAAGANTLVTVSVVPQGRNQRLQVRVMDIERGIPLMQSDSGNKWTF
jgi:cysteine synthase